VLRDAFPVTARLVGEEFFAAMARTYITREPPVSPMLFDYGRGFPDFIGGFAPAACLAYLKDVARIERAWVEAYHAPDARPTSPAQFAKISPRRLPDLRVALHPSLRVVCSQFAALTIWQMNLEAGGSDRLNDSDAAQDILIVRPDANVEVRVLPPGGAPFLKALGRGQSMLEATQSAMPSHPGFDLPAMLTGLISAGTFVCLGEATLTGHIMGSAS
jgi:hypothetical protein